jgi:hypothetical protein
MTQAEKSAAQATVPASTYATLRMIDVGNYIEKKNNLSYLSWAWAVDQLLQRDPSATWTYTMGKELVTGQGEDPVLVDVPYIRIGTTAMVFCTVNAFGVTRTAQLPVMDHRNKPIPNPDSFQVNTAMQRCLAKAIALHGIGLYIYAGEDIPQEEATPTKPEPEIDADRVLQIRKMLGDCESVDELVAAFNKLAKNEQDIVREYATALKKSLRAA